MTVDDRADIDVKPAEIGIRIDPEHIVVSPVEKLLDELQSMPCWVAVNRNVPDHLNGIAMSLSIGHKRSRCVIADLREAVVIT